MFVATMSCGLLFHLADKFDSDWKLSLCGRQKTSSTGSSSMVAQSQANKPISDGPGRSFRNFLFDTTSIFYAMEVKVAFST